MAKILPVKSIVFPSGRLKNPDIWRMGPTGPFGHITMGGNIGAPGKIRGGYSPAKKFLHGSKTIFGPLVLGEATGVFFIPFLFGAFGGPAESPIFPLWCF